MVDYDDRRKASTWTAVMQVQVGPSFVSVMMSRMLIMALSSIRSVNPFRTAVPYVCGDKPLKFRVVCPQNGAAVLKGLREAVKNKSDSWG